MAQVGQCLILRTWLLIVYVYVLARKIFCLGIYLKLSTYQGMQLSSSIVTINNKKGELLVRRNWRSFII